MTYPLPGETVTRTLTGVEFGGGYAPDEPAPELVAALFRGLHLAHLRAKTAWSIWERQETHEAWERYSRRSGDWQHRLNDLLREMGKHKYKSYLCNGYRIRLVIEPGGCRHQYLEITEVPE
jgi:hypothetical protein